MRREERGGWLEFLRVSEYSFATEGKSDAMRLSLASVSAFRYSLESSVSVELDGEDDCLVRSLSCWTVFERGSEYRSWKFGKRGRDRDRE